MVAFDKTQQGLPNVPTSEQEFSDPERIAAAQQLMAEGVEFEQFRRHMNTLLDDRYGIMFGKSVGSAWYAKRKGIRLVPSSGDKEYWLNLADLLMDVFTLLQSEKP